MKNEYTWFCQDNLALLERRWGHGVYVEQKNVLANTEPTKKIKLKPLGDRKEGV